ncbi:hypothetical protein [Endozoicomonas sp. SCSIO W0465]|uniref:hypothetical protein n=1 Tax=Endozoicomonas sp. SCSIO W0465 TaxID=2918516 RepID=UPI0020750AE4|nr:hypothetical protein [Endozoicomonas sp. SCSIO W0465]USE39514.1 hypothetical protein MJO57_15930 [Endozoicomonas sp. SCSIO W0465]
MSIESGTPHIRCRIFTFLEVKPMHPIATYSCIQKITLDALFTGIQRKYDSLMFKMNPEYPDSKLQDELADIGSLLKEINDKRYNLIQWNVFSDAYSVASKYIDIVSSVSSICNDFLGNHDQILIIKEKIIQLGFDHFNAIGCFPFDIDSDDYKAFEYFVKYNQFNGFCDYDLHSKGHLALWYQANTQFCIDIKSNHDFAAANGSVSPFNIFFSREFAQKVYLYKKLKEI